MALALAPIRNMQFPSSLFRNNSPTDNTSLHTTPSLPQSHHAATHRFSSGVYSLGVSGDVQLAFILGNCFLFTCCKYVQTPLQNQSTSCFISCLSVCWCFMEELIREKGKPVNAAGYRGSDSNYPRDVADHTGHVLWITQLLTRANAACYRRASWCVVIFRVILSLGHPSSPHWRWG